MKSANEFSDDQVLNIHRHAKITRAYVVLELATLGLTNIARLIQMTEDKQTILEGLTIVRSFEKCKNKNLVSEVFRIYQLKNKEIK